MQQLLDTHKEIATQFLLLVATGQIDEAYERFIDINGAHHNPYVAASFPALRKAMKVIHEQQPHNAIEVKDTIAEGEKVVVHAHVRPVPGTPGSQVVYIFRFKEGKIWEMWDFARVLPPEDKVVNKDGAF